MFKIAKHLSNRAGYLRMRRRHTVPTKRGVARDVRVKTLSSARKAIRTGEETLRFPDGEEMPCSMSCDVRGGNVKLPAGS